MKQRVAAWLAPTRPFAIRSANRVSRFVVPLVLKGPFRALLKKPSGTAKVVILGDYQSFDLLFRHERLNDYQIILVATKRYPFAKLFPRDFRRLGAVIMTPDFGDSSRSTLLEELRPFKPDAVLIQAGEFIVPMCNFLNRELGLRGNKESAALASLSKVEMRKALSKAGVNTLEFAPINDVEDLAKIDFWPVVLKPTIGTGGMGVQLARSADEAAAALRTATTKGSTTEFSGGPPALAEQYIEGRQFDVEGVVRNGTPQILCIVEEFYEEALPTFDHCWFLFNLPLPEAITAEIHRVVSASLAAAGINYGGFHCELRIDAKGAVRVLEFSNRLGGGFETTIHQATGADLVEAYICAMLDLSYEPPANINNYIIERYCRSTEEVQQWTTYCQNNGLSCSTKYRNFRSFKGIVHVSSYDWAKINCAMKDLLGVDIDAQNQSF